MSEQPKNQDEQVETAELADDAMEDISGGLPNGNQTTQNGQGADYSGVFN